MTEATECPCVDESPVNCDMCQDRHWIDEMTDEERERIQELIRGYEMQKTNGSET